MNKSDSILAECSQGRRITPNEALTLALNAPLHDLLKSALVERRRRFQDQAFFVLNQHLNFTNVCQNACAFCAYSKRPGEAGGYAYSLDKARQRIAERLHEPIREIHIVGGLNPELPYSYYLDLIRLAKDLRPEVSVKAYTAVEVAFLAEREKKSTREVLLDLKSAGLDGLPGGGAEVFSKKLRTRLCPEKISGEAWLRIHGEAHELKLPTNATMLFGHVETWEDRIDHLSALRDLQDQTGGFLCFIPLPYQPQNNPLQAKGPDGLTILKVMAVSRLFLDNIPHLKAYWVYLGLKTAQVALWAGADDMDGTLVEEKIGHAAGADTPQGLTKKELISAIHQAGFTPVERDTLFHPVPVTGC